MDDELRFTKINGGSRGPRRPQGKFDVEEFLNKIKGGSYILGIVALLAIWGSFSSFYTIDISEEGVVTRFGAYQRTTPSGFHLKLPFGIEQVYKVQSKRILQEEFGFRSQGRAGTRTKYSKGLTEISESLMLTGDLNVADVEWILQYRISDPWKFLFHARNVRLNIRDVSMSVMRRVVGDRLVSDVLTTGRVEIADQAKLITQQTLDKYDMGIKIEKIILQDVNPPKRVQPAFNEVNAAKQEQEQTINNAEKDRNKIIPRARGKAKQLVANAKAYSIDITNRAKGDAAQFEQVILEYRKAPDITRKRLYLDTMEEIFANVSQFTVVDSDIKGLLPIYSTPQVIQKEVLK